MNMIDALQRLKDAGLIVDFKTDDAGSEKTPALRFSCLRKTPMTDKPDIGPMRS
jgi:hypothetical protein